MAAVVDAKNGLNGVSHTLLKSGISALMQGLPAKDYPEAIVACDSLATGLAMRIPGINAIAIAAEAPTDVPELAIELPCVIGVPDLISSIKEGDILIVDGYKGIVHIDPDPQVLIHYQQTQEQQHAREKVFITSEHIPATTQTGETVLVYAALAGDTGLDVALRNGADGLLADLRGIKGDLTSLISRILREVAGKQVTFFVDFHLEEILRAAMVYCTPMQVTLVSDNPELLASQVDSALDRVTLEALQMDLEAPRVNVNPDETPVAVGDLAEMEQLILSGIRMVAVAPELVADAKFLIRSASLEDMQ